MTMSDEPVEPADRPAESWRDLMGRAVSSARRAGASREEAEDAAQTAIEQLLSRRDIDRPAGWLAKVSRDRHRDQVRRAQRERRDLARYQRRTGPPAASPEDLVAARVDGLAVLKIAQARLTDRQYAALIVHVRAGMTISAVKRELCTTLDISPETLKKHLAEARRKLRDTLGDDW